MDHVQLYANLMTLCNDEAFYHCDAVVEGFKHRTFTYRLASYTDFCKPDALEARGITFRLNDDGTTELVCFTNSKFHNLWECPFTANIKEEDVRLVMDKRDGSLISTVRLPNGNFTVKSKTSFYSEQARAAWQIIENDPVLKNWLSGMVNVGHTVNMEYTSPLNRIVLPYQKSELVILNIRSHDNGVTYFPYTFANCEIKPYVVDYQLTERFDYSSFQEYIDQVTGVEGKVCVTKDGLMFKIKTDWYVKLHHTKDSVNNPRRLYEVCIAGASDDLLAMFHDDPVTITMINEMQRIAFARYNHVVSTAETYYETNKHLSRKDFAIRAQSEAEVQKTGVFSLCMNLYVGKENDYNAFLIKNNEYCLREFAKFLESINVLQTEE